jgi:cytochrome c-type biogenesis protein CcmF
MISELITGTKITVGLPYFKSVTGPLFAVLVLLMGIAPSLSWRRQTARNLGKAIWAPFIASLFIAGVWGYLHRMHPGSIFGLWIVSFVLAAIVAEFWKGTRARQVTRGENPLQALVYLIRRNHRRYGGYIIHLGIILMTLGVIGDSFYKQETQGTVAPGERLTVGNYQLQFSGLRGYDGSDGREVTESDLLVYQNGRQVAEVKPRQDYFTVQQQPVTVPGVYTTAGTDVYTLLVGWELNGDAIKDATFKVYINSLINWVWIGGILMILGTIIGTWNGPEGREVSYAFRPNPVPASAGSQEA